MCQRFPCVGATNCGVEGTRRREEVVFLTGASANIPLKLEGIGDALEHTIMFVQVTGSGFHQASRAVELHEWRLKVADEGLIARPSQEQEAAQRKEAQKLADFAKGQHDQGSPMVYDLAAVYLWAVLEASIEDLTAKMFSRYAARVNASKLQKAKVNVADMLGKKTDEQYALLAEAVRREMRSESKGVFGFEDIFDVFGMKSDLPGAVERAFKELQALRNIILHRGAKMDLKASQECPWRKWNVGQTMHVAPRDFFRFCDAVLWYAISVTDRLKKLENQGNPTVGDRLGALVGDLEKAEHTLAS